MNQDKYPPMTPKKKKNKINIEATDDDNVQALESFEMAIRTLSQFHLVMLTEFMSISGGDSLKSLLGWENTKDIQHVVPAGKVMDNNAKQPYAKLIMIFYGIFGTRNVRVRFIVLNQVLVVYVFIRCFCFPMFKARTPLVCHMEYPNMLQNRKICKKKLSDK